MACNVASVFTGIRNSLIPVAAKFPFGDVF
jgi:hypothetical protein